ncbi:MAG: tRNA (adenosine(37)-N6)-threonylcarbamoyltransferase complex ATPase subunit type 1 TsaE [Firmicutes bacterium]|nr:tRNA (adenosine(37)-N6)-threonylcarbamoyltransferase complex ATPase subunit type 1 TsaE [Bacillota bacterium]
MSSRTTTLTTGSANETRQLGWDIGSCLQPGDTVCLSGDLGSGKTVLVQGIAEGIGAPPLVSSPTFTLMNQYQGRLLLLHLDLYRLESADELEELGWEEFVGRTEFMGRDAATVIEWAERIKPLLYEDYLDLDLERTGSGPERRSITLEGVGPSGKALLDRIKLHRADK